MKKIKELILELDINHHNGEHSCIGCLLGLVAVVALGLFAYALLVMILAA